MSPRRTCTDNLDHVFVEICGPQRIFNKRTSYFPLPFSRSSSSLFWNNTKKHRILTQNKTCLYIVDPVCGINNHKNHQTASQHIGNATPFQERAGHPCGKLSGGQKRRLWVATALKRGV